MPRFDFLCTDCKSTFEHTLPPGGPPPACLACGSPNVQKLLTPPPVIFKGSGFYKTDSGVPKKEPETPAKASGSSEKTPGPAPEKATGKEKTDPKATSAA